ncbi:MAG: beta-glucosidase [Paenibacillaceae bacterium]|jgi:beta-glucosidase|nr:beta-glucosidase [Paenibacillaceae bacterium]
MPFITLPKDFLWGVATAAYQVEGGTKLDGRGPSIWDQFCKRPGAVMAGESGDEACDSYNRLKDDISLLKELGVKAYRFSIAWPRIFPDGGTVKNEAGLRYYRELVGSLLEEGIEPVCTLYHWDLPQALQDRGGWNNRATITAFVHYAEEMFKEFNGKIRKWITFNEMFCTAFLGHYMGMHAPGEQDLQLAVNVAHHLLLAHGRTVQAFREGGCKGEIGLVINMEWVEPYSKREMDVQACCLERAWMKEWYLDPVFKGQYPATVLEQLKRHEVAPPVLDGDLTGMNQTVDFIGINYYTGFHGRYSKGHGLFDCEKLHFTADRMDVIDWAAYPEGLYYSLVELTERYGPVPIYITENGYVSSDKAADGKVHDQHRIDYIKLHLAQLDRAIADGVRVSGYFSWSLMDVFEWNYGYTCGLGLVHIDRQTLARTKKSSYYWYQKTISNGWVEL